MCDAHVIDAVKASMLSVPPSQRMSRRRVLGLGLAAASAGGVAMMMPPAHADTPHADAPKRVVDLTYPLHADFPTFSGKAQFSMEARATHAGDGYADFNLMMGEHTGTHIDAPLHFSADGLSVDALEPRHLIAPLVVIDIRAKAEHNPDAQLTPDDIRAFTKRFGAIPLHASVVMRSGWQRFMGTGRYRGFDGARQHYPGFHVEAVEMLIEDGNAASIGVDTLSLDYGATTDFATHRAWLPSGRFGIENLANLDAVPEHGAQIFIGAPKHQGGSGGPARILAVV